MKMLQLLTAAVLLLHVAAIAGDEPDPVPDQALQTQKIEKQQSTQLPAIQKVEAPEKVDIGKPQLAKVIISTKLTAHNMIGAVGDTVPLKATLVNKADDKPLVRQSLKFYVSGKLIGRLKTNKNGQALVNFKVPDETGSKEILVQFVGWDKYQSSSDTANIAVIKSSSKIGLSFFDAYPHYPGDRVDLSGKLYRITDNAGIKGREIIIEAQGKPVDKVASSLSGGGFFYQYFIPGDFTGNLKLSARFGGDSLFLGSVQDANVNVLPPKPQKKNVYVFWNSVAGQVGQPVTVNVKVSKSILYSEKYGVGGLHLGVYRIKDDRPLRMAEGHTDANGQFNAQFRLEEDSGKYLLNAGLIGGSDLYIINRVDQEKRNMTVTKSPVAIWVNGSTTARVGDELMFTATVYRTSDDSGISDIPVRFEDGQRKNTSLMGSAVFYYTVPGTLGPREINAKTWETDRYEAGSGSITLNILPKNN